VSYVATAQRIGLINGEFTDNQLLFEPNKLISKYEAADIMAKMLGVSASEEELEYSDLSEIPVSMRSSVLAMHTLGIFDSDYESLQSSDTVTKANAANYLYKMIALG